MADYIDNPDDQEQQDVPRKPTPYNPMVAMAQSAAAGNTGALAAFDPISAMKAAPAPLPVASPTTQPVAKPAPTDTAPPSTQPVQSPSSAPTPFSTPDPLAFMPLETATSQMMSTAAPSAASVTPAPTSEPAASSAGGTIYSPYFGHDIPVSDYSLSSWNDAGTAAALKAAGVVQDNPMTAAVAQLAGVNPDLIDYITGSGNDPAGYSIHYKSIPGVTRTAGDDPLHRYLNDVADAQKAGDYTTVADLSKEFAAKQTPPQDFSTEPHYLIGGVDQNASGNPIPGGYNAADDVLRQLTGAGASTSSAPAPASPASQPGWEGSGPANGGTIPTLGGGPIASPGGTVFDPNDPTHGGAPDPAYPGNGGTDVPGSIPLHETPTAPPVPLGTDLPPTPGVPIGPGTASGPPALPPSPPAAPSAPPPLSAPPPTTIPIASVPTSPPPATYTPTTPDNSLTNTRIQAGPATDRFAIANSRLQSLIHDTLDPQFAADNRDALRYAAAGGTIGSGQLNTTLGDILSRRTHDINSAATGFYNDALNGSIEDAFRSLGIDQQQQAFQADQQKTAFGQQVTLQQLADSELGQQFGMQMQAMGFNAQQIQQAFENAYRVQQLSDDETGQAFYRALQQFIAGNSGDPASVLEWLAGQYARGPSLASAA